MDSPKNISKSKLARQVLIGLSIAAAVYLLMATLGDGAQLWVTITQFGALNWLCVLLLSVGNYVLRAVRWQLFLNHLEQHPPIFSNAMAYLSGFALTLTPGKLGELSRCIHLRALGVNYDASMSACVVERAGDLIAVVIIAIPALLLNSQYLLPGVLLLSVVAIGMLFLSYTPLQSWCLGRLARFDNGPINKLSAFLTTTLSQARRLLQPNIMTLGLLLAVLGWACEGAGLYLVLQAFDVDISVAIAMGIFGIAMIVGAISFLPGGLGTTEATMIGLLVLAGADVHTATASTLICRIATLWFAVVVGIGATASLNWLIPKAQHSLNS